MSVEHPACLHCGEAIAIEKGNQKPNACESPKCPGKQPNAGDREI